MIYEEFKPFLLAACFPCDQHHKAFDNVSFKAIATALNKTKLDPVTAHWIANMVATRHITINHKDSAKTIRIKRGCPQGGILSPFLWNLVVDDLLNLTPKDTPDIFKLWQMT